MTYAEKAKQLNITIEELRKEQYQFLQSEGYDDKGNEHQTIDSWVKRKKSFEFDRDSDSGFDL